MANDEARCAATPPDGIWDRGWEEQRRRQLLAHAAATPAQRLQWLEEMIALAHRTGALPKVRAVADAALPAPALTRCR
ncbi:MAG: hypothetical protein JXR83_08060 [Deltaproteobacteria bacterium]|nr:hypothetical protein [Deltaproteobacteria bacterium]